MNEWLWLGRLCERAARIDQAYAGSDKRRMENTPRHAASRTGAAGANGAQSIALGFLANHFARGTG